MQQQNRNTKNAKTARPTGKFNHLRGTRNPTQRIQNLHVEQILRAVLKGSCSPVELDSAPVLQELELAAGNRIMLGLYDAVTERFLGSPDTRSACAVLGVSFNKIVQLIQASDRGWGLLTPKGDVRIPWFDTVLIDPRAVVVEVGLLKHAISVYLNEVQYAKG